MLVVLPVIASPDRQLQVMIFEVLELLLDLALTFICGSRAGRKL
jgi:hypothetical protein